MANLILGLGVGPHRQQELNSFLLASLSCLMQRRLPIILHSLQAHVLELNSGRRAT